MPGPDIFQQLKEATEDLHEQVEERVPIFDPQFDVARYIQVIERFYGFWAPLETKLSELKALDDPALDLRGRAKSHLLEADLLLLGSDPARLRHCGHLPEIDTFSRGLGCLYVLEGSTLGARVISRRIESHLGLGDGSGGSFFNAYGGETGRRWSEFKSFVAAHAGAGESEEMVSAARQTFQCLDDWLSRVISYDGPRHTA